MDMPDLMSPATATFNRGEGEIHSLRMMALKKNGKMSDRQMRETAVEFEAMVLRQLLKEMRKTIPKSELSENSFSTEMYTEIVDDHLAKQMAESNTFGLSDVIYAELKEKNEKIKNPSEKNQDSFISLKSRGGETNAENFIPLAVDSDQFIRLHNESKMMELQWRGNQFMELQRGRSVPTDKIQS
ncbi:MAG: hypothetical protein C4527_09545 [Candidatus Omnitrophota bacterium]|jgi:flagellar protein FlgJ|nr:MAG: hypothetical protein C4527_09545 [Candidatus Omnitrophota bacterium]